MNEIIISTYRKCHKNISTAIIQRGNLIKTKFLNTTDHNHKQAHLNRNRFHTHLPIMAIKYKRRNLRQKYLNTHTHIDTQRALLIAGTEALTQSALVKAKLNKTKVRKHTAAVDTKGQITDAKLLTSPIFPLYRTSRVVNFNDDRRRMRSDRYRRYSAITGHPPYGG